MNTGVFNAIDGSHKLFTAGELLGITSPKHFVVGKYDTGHPACSPNPLSITLMSNPRDNPFKIISMCVSAKCSFAMFRLTITCGNPLVWDNVAMYCSGLCVCPRSPNGSVPFKNKSPAFALISINSETLNFFKHSRASPIFAKSFRTIPAFTWLTSAITSPVL